MKSTRKPQVIADLIRENEMRIICDNCGMEIAPDHLRFHARDTLGPLLKLCAECCTKEEAVICDCCGKVIPPGVMPHLRMAGLPIPFLHRLCVRCGQVANAMSAIIGDNSPEYDDFWLS